MTQQEKSLEQWLADVRGEYWQGIGEGVGGEDVEVDPFALFGVAGRRFAVDARCAKGVVRVPRVTRLPGTPPHVLGVAGVRGEVVSVTDPAVFLRVPGERPPGEGFLLILAAEGTKAALWVDRVADVVPIPRSEVLSLETPWAGVPEGLLSGQWGEERDPVLLLDGPGYLSASAVGPPGR